MHEIYVHVYTYTTTDRQNYNNYYSQEGMFSYKRNYDDDECQYNNDGPEHCVCVCVHVDKCVHA